METVADRFWKKVAKSAACWEWKASFRPVAVSKQRKTRSRNRYGQFWLAGRLVYAHRVAWELLNGPISEGYRLDNQCGNEKCVRPEHWRLIKIRKYEKPSSAALLDHG